MSTRETRSFITPGSASPGADLKPIYIKEDVSGWFSMGALGAGWLKITG
jgi:hypothetical protein